MSDRGVQGLAQPRLVFPRQRDVITGLDRPAYAA